MRLNEYLESNQKGFTLIELLIALAIGSIVLLAAYNLFISQKKSHELQGQLVDAEQNARAALDLLTRELRLAGSGINTTTLRRTTATLISDAAAGATTLSVASSTGFSSGDTIYLINIPTTNNPTVAERRTITAISNNIFTLDTALSNTYTAFRTEIFKESSQAITTATENSITFSAVLSDGGTATAVTYSFLNANDTACESPNIGAAFSPCKITRNIGSGNQPLAENIDYFQIRYYDAKDFPIPNPAPNPYTGINLTDAGGDAGYTQRARIRKVNIQIVAVASRDDPGYTATGTYDDGTTYADRGSSNRRRTLLEADIAVDNWVIKGLYL